VPWVLDRQQHVVTGELAWVLHPCETAARLQLMMVELHQSGGVAGRGPLGHGTQEQQVCPGSSPQWLLRYMLAWWSCVGPLLGLPCPKPCRHG
jgi:hypothetical protein